MGKGISVHIGLNFVDKKKYDGWSGDLMACEYDANDMADLAKQQDFDVRAVLLSKDATSKAVLAILDTVAQEMTGDDVFFISYSGHGGQIPETGTDPTNDEPDMKDETWLLYDRQLIDDELAAVWSRFPVGSRVVMLSDSCHSGSVAKALMPLPSGEPPRTDLPASERVRVALFGVTLRNYRENAATYDAIRQSAPGGDDEPIEATVLLISGCQDDQESADGDRNGLFTQQLLGAWNGGQFRGSYAELKEAIAAKMPADQTPNLHLHGASPKKLSAERAFSI